MKGEDCGVGRAGERRGGTSRSGCIKIELLCGVGQQDKEGLRAHVRLLLVDTPLKIDDLALTLVGSTAAIHHNQ